MIEHWGDSADGSKIYRVSIADAQLSAKVISFGACLQDLRFAGCDYPLVLGYDRCAPYLRNERYFGASVGRFANRIAHGRANLGDKVVTLDQNAGPHHLHGGRAGATFRNWVLQDRGPCHVVFTDTLPDGHMGFPGSLTISARYEIAQNALTLTYRATTDATTLCSFTGHSYFHLDETTDLAHHTLAVEADRYTERSEDGIPTGDLLATRGSKLDYRRSRELVSNGQLAQIDDNFCLAPERGPLKKAATLTSKASGLVMDLSTTEPGLQVYTMAQDGDLAPTSAAKSRTGIALEPQVWPDAPNHAGFPTAILEPGDVYRHETRYTFRLG